MALEVLGRAHRFVPYYTEQTETVQCFGCGEDASGPRYICLTCDTHLHQTCANLRKTITHPLHRYPMELVLDPLPNYEGECRCMLCLNICHALAYRCSHCELILDIRCATSPKFTDPNRFTRLKHFIHKHDLVFLDNHTDEAANFMCIRCHEHLSGPINCCVECGFRIHGHCLEEIPEKINHPCHRKHPLQVLPCTYGDLSARLCDVCESPCTYDLTYNCRSCDFDVHDRCRQLPSTMDSEIHQHSLSLLSRKCQFLCRGCGKEGSCAPYVCTECSNLVLHKDCVSLPHRVKAFLHDHVLYHTLYISRIRKDPEEESSDEKAECQICHKKLNPNHGSYGCLECNYVAHVDCALDKKIWDRSLGRGKYPDDQKQQRDEGTSLSHKLSSALASTPTQTSPVIHELENKMASFNGDQVTLTHVSHNHDLTLDDKVPDKEILPCYACFLPIVAGSNFYKCSPCDFFLHSDCAFLPQIFKHWDHLDEFVLVNVDHLFICGVCKYPCTGFSYTCVNCNASICLRCKQIAQDKYTNHKGHEHQLFSDHTYDGRPCDACGNICGQCSRDGIRFPAWRCKECGYAVDSRCLTLPERAQHTYHEHLLKLNFHDNDPNRCYCDICEKMMNPKHWFYSCEQGCDFKAHSKCVLGSYPFVRTGHEFNSSSHEHTTLQLSRFEDFPDCFMCGVPIDDTALKCKHSDCNYTIHWDCLFLQYGLRFTPTASN